MSDNSKVVRRGTKVEVPLVGELTIGTKAIEYNVIVKLDLRKEKDMNIALDLLNHKKIDKIKRKNYVFVGDLFYTTGSKIGYVVRNTSFNSNKNIENLLSLYCIVHRKPIINFGNINRNTKLQSDIDNNRNATQNINNDINILQIDGNDNYNNNNEEVNGTMNRYDIRYRPDTKSMKLLKSISDSEEELYGEESSQKKDIFTI